MHGGRLVREVPLSPELLPVLTEGIRRCPAADYIFPGRNAGRHLSMRSAQAVLRATAGRVELAKPVSTMTLRHSFAVHALEAGWSIRAVQEALGHCRIESTLIYERLVERPESCNPLDRLYDNTSSHPANPVDRNEFPGEVFGGDLSVDGLELPLPCDDVVSMRSRAAEFYSLLKTHLLGRFLALRSAVFRGS